MIDIINKEEADKNKKTPDEKEKIKDLNEYCGYYIDFPWESEMYLSTWNGNLVRLDLPAESPVKSMTFLKHIKGDTFRRIRDNGELAETVVFERNAKGEVTQFKQHNNYCRKINRIEL
jgi:hypothetical protein